MSVYAFQNLKSPTNRDSGVGERLLFAPVSWFTTIKCPAAPFTNPGDKVTIREEHVFKAGKAFVEVYMAPRKNSLSGQSIGDIGFSKMDVTYEGMVQGSYGALHEMVGELLNLPVIVLIPDANCDSKLWYQLGCDCGWAFASASFATGTTAEGNKGYTLSFNCPSSYIRLYRPADGEDPWEGPVVLADD